MKYTKARQNLVDMYIKSLEEDIVPWEKLWTVEQPVNAISGKKYKGINNLALSYIAVKKGYKDNRWCTYNQIKKRNWKFKESAVGQGVCVEYWSKYNIKERRIYSFKEYERAVREDPEQEENFRIITKCTTVFNGDLIDGIPKQKEKEKEQLNTSEYIKNIIDNIGVKYQEFGNSAYYNIANDIVVLPPINTFKNEYGYYSTQLHELAHSTGHKSRLNRDLSGGFGSPEYAKEELRAEISSSFLMQKLGLEYDEKHLKNHKAYIQNWIDILKDKPNELFKAISDADKIVDYMEEKSLIKTLDNEKEMELDEYEI